jgi:hypothetical protein
VAKVNVNLVPMGSLSLVLPSGASCAIAGMSISEVSTRNNYGSLPAGSYKLSVTGGDFESYSETVSVERGKRLEFAPKLRYTADYLAAKYRIDLDRLQAVLSGGAASQADVEDAAVLAKKIRAEGRSELGELATRAEGLRASLAALRPAAAGAGAAVPAATGKGVLVLESDPPGMLVSVDGGAADQTPIRLELSPGAHSFEPKESVMGSLWYAAQSLQWITVTAGNETRVPIRVKQETASLSTKLVPEGFKVFLNETELGESPLREVEVPAGFLRLRFEKAGEPMRNISLSAKPGASASVSWGDSAANAIWLQRATIKLDGLPDSWAEIDPIFEANINRPFLGDPRYAVKRVFVCRDDKYLYWRVDFNEANPLDKSPKGSGKATTVQISPWMDALQKNFDMAVSFNREGNRMESYLGSYDGRTQKYTKIADNVISSKQGKTMFAARLELSYLKKYCPYPGSIEFTLANVDNNWKWDDSTKVAFKLGWVDFSK